MLSGLVLAVRGTGGPDELAQRRLREGGKQHLPTGISIRERRQTRVERREKLGEERKEAEGGPEKRKKRRGKAEKGEDRRRQEASRVTV